METQALALQVNGVPTPMITAETVEKALMVGDFSKMDAQTRVAYYLAVCQSAGLNPLTRPFIPMKTQSGEVVLYATRECAEQLRAKHRMSIRIVSRERFDDLYCVTVLGSLPDGRTEEAQGIVEIHNLKGQALANALMKAECLPLDSDILTREGWKTYNQVVIGEEVLAYDMGNDCCQWTPVLQVNTYDSLPMVAIHSEGDQFTVRCTPEHTWAVQRSIPYVPDMRGGGSRGPRGPYVSRGPLRALIPTNELKSTHRLILAAATQDTEASLLEPIEAALLGWAVTDGTIKRVGNSVCIGVCQSKSQNFEAIREVVFAVAPEVTERVGLATQRIFPSGKTSECLPQHWWYLPAKISRALLQKAGFTTSADLPKIVTRLDHAARQAMLHAMMLADADQRGTFAKKDRHKMDAFQILCALEGYATGQEHQRPAVIAQRLKKTKHVAVKFLVCEPVEPSPAWCPTTAYGTWVMRQNGRVMITGNSKAKRRATLALCGLGIAFLDEALGHDVAFNVQTGELIGELCDEAESVPADTQPIRHEERQGMLAPVGLWMRSIKPASRGGAIHAVFGSPLSPEEIKQLDRRDLDAGLQRLKMGNEAGIDWESVTLEDDLEKAAARSAAKAKDDLFGGDRQEANTPADIVVTEDFPASQAYQSPPTGQTVARPMPARQAPAQDAQPVVSW